MTSPYDEHGRPRREQQGPPTPPPGGYGGPAPNDQGGQSYGQPGYGNPGPYAGRGHYAGPHPGGGYGPYGGAPRPADDERSLAAIAHVATLIGMLVSVGWLGFVVPLVMWLVFRNSKPFVRHAAAGAFNFNVTVLIANVVAYVLAFTLILLPISILIWVVFGIMALVFHIIGTVRASRGQPYRYPLQIPILR